MGVTRASKKLRIKIPTAKVILSIFRKKGIIFKKKSEKIMKNTSEAQSINENPRL